MKKIEISIKIYNKAKKAAIPRAWPPFLVYEGYWTKIWAAFNEKIVDCDRKKVCDI